jgi:hypothetical protein
MEVFENARDIDGVEAIAQTMTNLMHLRPHFNFGVGSVVTESVFVRLISSIMKAEYFSRDYVMHTKALELQCQLVVSIVQRLIENSREWLQRFKQKLEQQDMSISGLDNTSIDRRIYTPDDTGLPFTSGNKLQTRLLTVTKS